MTYPLAHNTPTLVTLWKVAGDRVMAIIRDPPAASTSVNSETNRRENAQAYMASGWLGG